MDLLFNIIVSLIRIYSYGVIIYIFMSWFPGARESSIGQFLGSIVEPFLEPFRRFIPPIGMIDISPIVALITLQLATEGLAVVFNNLSRVL
ncbi:YggT family protein [Bacillus carboniphilus]|uniref:YggT family protein n=1 Tax=Bacillus carboniphilus TaxID=86663 RepID=A0ABY9JW31_9BACI|nr:YggT family protein [Bacillus carboniphilus]WLR43611.1 YggT family protein [Bacillus carboniphilus]